MCAVCVCTMWNERVSENGSEKSNRAPQHNAHTSQQMRNRQKPLSVCMSVQHNEISIFEGKLLLSDVKAIMNKPTNISGSFVVCVLGTVDTILLQLHFRQNRTHCCIEFWATYFSACTFLCTRIRHVSEIFINTQSGYEAVITLAPAFQIEIWTILFRRTQRNKNNNK